MREDLKNTIYHSATQKNQGNPDGRGGGSDHRKFYQRKYQWGVEARQSRKEKNYCDVGGNKPNATTDDQKKEESPILILSELKGKEVNEKRNEQTFRFGWNSNQRGVGGRGKNSCGEVCR